MYLRIWHNYGVWLRFNESFFFLFLLRTAWYISPKVLFVNSVYVKVTAIFSIYEGLIDIHVDYKNYYQNSYIKIELNIITLVLFCSPSLDSFNRSIKNRIKLFDQNFTQTKYSSFSLLRLQNRQPSRCSV